MVPTRLAVMTRERGLAGAAESPGAEAGVADAAEEEDIREEDLSIVERSSWDAPVAGVRGGGDAAGVAALGGTEHSGRVPGYETILRPAERGRA
ncbi:hypothetical protein GCM10009724_01940 [Microbacterium lacticum]|nr:hypothetical protein MLA01_01820 [Microbacterium lacticum]GGN12203.1 hypothetical protein GCM10009724_01940 [Microbacterium lacticum]